MNFQCGVIPGPLRGGSPTRSYSLPLWKWGLWSSVSGEHLLSMLTGPCTRPAGIHWSLIPQTLLLPPMSGLS